MRIVCRINSTLKIKEIHKPPLIVNHHYTSAITNTTMIRCIENSIVITESFLEKHLKPYSSARCCYLRSNG